MHAHIKMIGEAKSLVFYKCQMSTKNLTVEILKLHLPPLGQVHTRHR